MLFVERFLAFFLHLLQIFPICCDTCCSSHLFCLWAAANKNYVLLCLLNYLRNRSSWNKLNGSFSYGKQNPLFECLETVTELKKIWTRGNFYECQLFFQIQHQKETFLGTNFVPKNLLFNLQNNNMKIIFHHFCCGKVVFLGKKTKKNEKLKWKITKKTFKNALTRDQT